VFFDENIFTFAKLHPKVGAKLRFEIIMLPPCLLASESLHNGVNILDGPVANVPNTGNQISVVCGGV
jgi:hypothetical protein